MASILSESTNSNQEDEDVTALVRQAYMVLSQNRVEQAIEMYQRIIEQHPACWRAYQNLGVAFIMRRDFQKANNVLKTYVLHAPRDPLGHDSLGVSYSQLNDPLQAICSFVNAINLSPTYYMSYYNLGVVLGKLGLYQYALNVYNHCLTLQPDYINAINNVADIYKKQDKMDEAIQMFKHIIEIDPSYLLAIKNLGNCYFAQGDFYEAMMTYLKAGEVDNFYETILVNISLGLDHFKLYRQAADYAFKAHLQSSALGDDASSTHQVFIGGTLYAKEITRLYRILRIFCRLRKNPPPKLIRQFYKSYLEIVGCFNTALEKMPQISQIQQNILRTQFNFLGYRARLAQATIMLKNKNQIDQNLRIPYIMDFLKQQKAIIPVIFEWRKYTKRLIKIKKKGEKKQLEQQRNELFKAFGKPSYQDIQKLDVKTSTYLSRRFNHNLRRLILKRCKFIKKYNFLNRKCDQLFRHKEMKITFTDSDQPINQGQQNIDMSIQ